MAKEYQLVTDSSLLALGFKIEEMISCGWKIDKNNPLTQLGWTYECGFVRDEGTGSEPPKTPQERAAYAREMRAKKMAEKNGA